MHEEVPIKRLNNEKKNYKFELVIINIFITIKGIKRLYYC